MLPRVQLETDVNAYDLPESSRTGYEFSCRNYAWATQAGVRHRAHVAGRLSLSVPRLRSSGQGGNRLRVCASRMAADTLGDQSLSAPSIPLKELRHLMRGAS
jgi:hypothetical protein